MANAEGGCGNHLARLGRSNQTHNGLVTFQAVQV
jgi:hypothetical protein